MGFHDLHQCTYWRFEAGGGGNSVNDPRTMAEEAPPPCFAMGEQQ